MEQIVQLRTMRDEALERLQANPDFKLVNSLDALIRDLEAVVVPVAVSAPVVEATESEDNRVEEVTPEVEALSSEPATPEVADMVAETELSGLSEELSSLSETLPDDTAAAIEALEAELSQSSTLVEPDGSLESASVDTNSTIN